MVAETVEEITESTDDLNADVLFEEDIEAAQERFVSVLGPNGKVNPDGKFYRVYSPKYHILWYGDLDTNDLDRIRELSENSDAVIYVVPEIRFWKSIFASIDTGIQQYSDFVIHKGEYIKNRY